MALRRRPVGHTHDTAGEVGGEGLTGKQRKAKEQRQGSKRLRPVHGISGAGTTAPILIKLGREGESGERAVHTLRKNKSPTPAGVRFMSQVGE